MPGLLQKVVLVGKKLCDDCLRQIQPERGEHCFDVPPVLPLCEVVFDAESGKIRIVEVFDQFSVFAQAVSPAAGESACP